MIDVKLLYPIGSIYMSIQDTNPSAFFGGTWERIAKGKTLVGVDENDTDFNTSSKTGGEKEHTLTISETPSHYHTAGKYDALGINHASVVAGSGVTSLVASGSTTSTHVITNNSGGNQPHNNLQPFYTCYIFVRTA